MKVMNWLIRVLKLGDSAHVVRRLKLAASAIGANFLSRLIAFFVLIYSTRVVLQQIGVERFGIWSTITSISLLLNFFDFGISNALVSRVAALHGDRHVEKLQNLVTSALASLAAIGLVVAGILCLVSYYLPLDLWFHGASQEALRVGRITAMLFAVFFGAGFLSQGVLRVYMGMQLGWIANLGTAISYCVSAAAIKVGPIVGGDMPYYLFATYGVQQLVGILMLFGLWRRGLFSNRQVAFAAIRDGVHIDFFKQSGLYFIIQISVAIIWGSNQTILSSIAGPNSAAEFSILQRLFMCMQVGLTVLNAPLWAMYADAFSKGEKQFVRNLLQRSMIISVVLAVIGCTLLTVVHGVLLSRFFSYQETVMLMAVILMAAWTVLDASGNVYAMYLNGVGILRPMVIVSVAFAVVGLPMKIYAAHKWGVIGLLSAMICSYLVLNVLPLLTFFRKECWKPITGLQKSQTADVV